MSCIGYRGPSRPRYFCLPCAIRIRVGSGLGAPAADARGRRHHRRGLAAPAATGWSNWVRRLLPWQILVRVHSVLSVRLIGASDKAFGHLVRLPALRRKAALARGWYQGARGHPAVHPAQADVRGDLGEPANHLPGHGLRGRPGGQGWTEPPTFRFSGN